MGAAGAYSQRLLAYDWMQPPDAFFAFFIDTVLGRDSDSVASIELKQAVRMQRVHYDGQPGRGASLLQGPGADVRLILHSMQLERNHRQQPPTAPLTG